MTNSPITTFRMTFENSDYPNLVKPDEKVESIGVPAVLAVYNWPENSDRFRKIERFIQYYFNRFDKFKELPRSRRNGRRSICPRRCRDGPDIGLRNSCCRTNGTWTPSLRKHFG